MAETDTPLAARIRLSHAYMQRLARDNGVDILHIKGYAFGEDTYRESRHSSDVDVLVRPAHVNRFMYLLQADGWRILTHFETGSIFEHAATLYHPTWGLTDVHRYFPGVGFENPALAFEKLWKSRRSKDIAHFSCDVTSLVDSRVLVVVHGARSLSQEHPDIRYLRTHLSEEQWSELRRRAIELGSEIAFDTALGNLEAHRDSPYYLLWRSVSEPVPAYVQWWARLGRERTLAGKVRVVRQIFAVNEDHLAMSLGHEPSAREKRQKFFARFEKLKLWRAVR